MFNEEAADKLTFSFIWLIFILLKTYSEKFTFPSLSSSKSWIIILELFYVFVSIADCNLHEIKDYKLQFHLFCN